MTVTLSSVLDFKENLSRRAGKVMADVRYESKLIIKEEEKEEEEEEEEEEEGKEISVNFC